jgi:hypothetical protein
MVCGAKEGEPLHVDVFARGQSAGPALRCPFFAATERDASAACDHRCSLANHRFWRPSAELESNTCLTPRFARCPRFMAASGSTSRGDAAALLPDSRCSEAERTLSWIGVWALGCVAGIAISAVAFLLLPSAGDRTNASLQSDVAGIVATAAPPKTSVESRRGGDYQMTEAEERAEIPRPVQQAATAAPQAAPEYAEPAAEPGPATAFAGGEPAGLDEATHVVEEGETLWGIAADNGIDARDLAARNGLPEDALVVVGDVIVIPAATVDSQP